MSQTANTGRKRLPAWLRKNNSSTQALHDMRARLRCSSLSTVCEEAKCPNMGECFSRGTATFMIMGDICTRNCRFCAVKNGVPAPLDADEPRRVASQIKSLGLKHAVITSVTRDDLTDGGASHFASIIREIKSASPSTTIEVLTPDFCASKECIKLVCAEAPNVFNHNIETVERLTPKVRDKAKYALSLQVLSTAAKYLRGGFIKSGLMVGLGETKEEVRDCLSDLKQSGCEIVTIGQYLRPRLSSIDVAEYIEPSAFAEYESIGLELGLKHVFAGPFVRSSYLADRTMLETTKGER